MTEDIDGLCVSLEKLSNKNSFLRTTLKPYSESKKKTKSRDRDKILEVLSESILKTDCYYDIVLSCSNLIPELLYRNFNSRVSHAEFQKKCIILSKIVELRPDISKIAVDYVLKNKPFYSTSTDEPERKRKKIEVPSEEERLTALSIFVKREPLLFRRKWNWNNFLELLQSSNQVVKCLASEILCDTFQVSTGVRSDIWKQHLESKILVDVIHRSKMTSEIIRGSAFDISSIHNILKLPNIDDVFLSSKMSDLNLKYEISYILTPSIRKVCHLIALSIAEGKSTLLKGSNGSGKTALLKYIASLTNRHRAPHFLTIQLSEQTDSKTLLGTYRCTPVPGQFEWVDGTLTTAVLKGHWLLLEDIDKASDDVVSLLAPLLNNSYLSIPGHRNNVRTHPDFRLFATRRSIGSFLLQNQKWNLFEMPELERGEMLELLNGKYPNLTNITEKLIDIFDVSKSLRPCSLRDITKFCNRVSPYIKDDILDVNSLFMLLQEAAEIFVLSSSSKAKRLKTLTHIGSLLNVNPSQCDHLASAYRPDISCKDEEFTSGRVTLKKYNQDCLYEWTNTRQAANLVENLAACVLNNEPALLVGETGTGKTSAVQYLASNLGKSLSVINMNQYTDCTDLLGGYKPVGGKVLVNPIREEFQQLFRKSFNEKENTDFIGKVNECIRKSRWKLLLKLMRRICDVGSKKHENRELWLSLKNEIDKVQNQISQIAFSFVEGSLVEAVQKGHWILLDELNLAPPDTLDGLISLLDPDGSLTLLEKGDKVPIKRHPEFRLFACMNPATDVGKRHLPAGVRNRFTELYVEELTERSELLELVDFYLKDLSVNKRLINTVVDLYKTLRKNSEAELEDGTGRKPHYSLRTLCRALRYARSQKSPNFSYSLYEAFCLSFLTCLNRQSEDYVELEIRKAFTRKGRFLQLGNDYLSVKGYWIKKGIDEPFEMKDYIITDTVDLNLKNLARAASACLPILVQGETSVGKTSLIKYLARLTGNTVLRINNHEHTDMQEYIGCYTTDNQGLLTYQDGVLVQAMRKGYWIILDELNLAPTDVLEALNRVLDDNRELLITETREVVKADSKFMLFATQNPAGTSYGGRKELSRAFRNRFIELHFDLLPQKELVQIVHKRCEIPESYAEKLVKVMKDLQLVRRKSGVFVGKEGFITLRDLFRWANRYRLTEGKNKDWNQFLAEQGFMLLAGRVRCEDEAIVVKEIIERAFPRTKILENDLFSQANNIIHQLMNSHLDDDFKHLVWTKSLRRMAVLSNEAINFSEPVLLVGQTGCGKTTLSYLFANHQKSQLWSISCHRNTEVGDILGSLRPVRNRSENDRRLFEWVDGPLVESMQSGGFFLLDEVSLTDDSVIERLNSVLELDRSLVLAEKGGEEVFASENFRLIATMNPGGDFGKKELSPALRNRFTEIWCLSDTNKADLVHIIRHNSKRPEVKAESMVDFVDWLKNKESLRLKESISIRDYLNWIEFINRTNYLDLDSASFHGGCMSFIDAFGTGTIADDQQFSTAKQDALARLKDYFPNTLCEENFEFSVNDSHIKIGPFIIEKGPETSIIDKSFNFSAPTTKANVLKIVRALALDRPILLEGSPGVGKTTVVQELAKIAGFKVTRINLSEQTDISDLFGADLPVEGGRGGLFEWRDGPILKALKNGYWIILDELNLASQSVLEGLNAILDHRGEIFIPELNRTFKVSKKKTRLFGCQNPYVQGAGRKGLPQSFLNRFVKVFAQILTREDLVLILNNAYPEVSKWSEKMIDFNCKISDMFKNFWEFNLRDVFRWCDLIKNAADKCRHPSYFVRTIYTSRMRNEVDVIRVLDVYRLYFDEPNLPSRNLVISNEILSIGDCKLERNNQTVTNLGDLHISHKFLSVGESFLQAVKNGWMIMLVGPGGCGKTSIVKTMADLAGRNLSILNINANMDTIELLGGFEQADVWRLVHEIQDDLELKLTGLIGELLKKSDKRLENILEKYSRLNFKEDNKNLNHIEECFKSVLNYLPDDSASKIKEKLVKLEAYRTAAGKFDWIDSQLIRSMQKGDWLLVHGANICSPSVLDRLNPLLEPNGTLNVTERGVIDGEIVNIKPHRDFRIILELDFRHGELSRAMRNRGLEIFIDSDSDHDLKSIIDIKEEKITNILIHYYKLHGRSRLENLARSSSLCKQLMQNGENELMALKCSIDHVYGIQMEENDLTNSTNKIWTFGKAKVKDFQHSVSIGNAIRFSEYLHHVIINEERNFITDFIIPYLTMSHFKSDDFVLSFLQSRYPEFKDILDYCSKFNNYKSKFLISFFYYLQSCTREENLIKCSRNAKKAFNPYHPSILFIEKFTELVFGEIISYFEISDLTMDNISYKFLNELIAWKNFCSIDISTYNVEEYISLLTLHLNWINKRILRKLPNISGPLKSILEELEELIPQENAFADSQRKIMKSLTYKTRGITSGKEIIVENLKSIIGKKSLNEPAINQICHLYSLISNTDMNDVSVRENIEKLEFLSKECYNVKHDSRSIKKDVMELLSCKDGLKIVKDIFIQKIDENEIRNSVKNGLKYCENGWDTLHPLNHRQGMDFLLPGIFNRLQNVFRSSAILHTTLQTKLAFELCNKSVTLKDFTKNSEELKDVTESLFIKSFDNSCTLSNFAFIVFKMLERLKIAINDNRIQLPNDTLFLIWSVLQNLSTDHEEDFQVEIDQQLFIAQLSIQIGLIFLFTFQPLSTVDPVYRNRIKRHLGELQCSNLVTELNIREDYQFRLTGLSNLEKNERINYLSDRINNLKDKFLVEIEKTYRPNTTDFIKLHEEIRGFTMALNSSFIMILMTNIEAVNGNDYTTEIAAFRETLMKFTDRIKNFDYFHDITGPILNGVAMISHGLDLATVIFDQNLDALVQISLLWPLNMHLEHLLCEDTVRILSKNSTKAPNQITWDLCEIALADIQAKNHTLKRISEDDVSIFEIALQKFLIIWSAIDEEKRRKVLEEESLYKVKEHGEKLTEEEREEREICKLFPEFSDFENLETENSDFGLTNTKLKEVLNLLSKASLENFSEKKELIWKDSICKRNMLLSDILQKNTLRETHDKHLLFTLLVSQKHNTSNKQAMSFYHESNIQQAVQSISVLEQMQKAVSLRLEEWSEHPTLVKINEIVNKILNLPVNSVLARFAAGLQLLLMECEEWQKVASQRVSLIEEIGNITQVLVSYRKIELENWKEILDFEYDKCQLNCSEFAFRILAAAKDVKTSDDIKTCLDNIKAWIENANLGDFKERYHLLSIVHVSCLSFNKNLAIGIYNIMLMYSIFVEQITDTFDVLKKPIDKELKSFVKICRWNDRTFWALKTGVEKAHKTVHKFVKRFKEILYGKADLVLKDDELNVTELLEHIPKISLTKLDMKLDMDNVKNLNDKAFKYCTWIIKRMQDTQYRIDIQEIRLDILKTYKNFQSAVIPTDKEERKKFIKNLQHRKRKSLSDYVSDFTKMGLSYRKGLKDSEDSEKNLNDVYSIDKCMENYDLDIVKFWTECKNSHVRSICRKAQLDQAFKTPSKELTTAEIHRSYGLSRHLNSIEQKLWRNLCHFLISFFEFNADSSELKKFVLEGWTLQQSLKDSVIQLQTQVSNGLIYLSQFIVLYENIPKDIVDKIYIYNMGVNKELLKKRDEVLSLLKINVKTLESFNNRLSGTTSVLTKKDANDLMKIRSQLNEVKESLEKISLEIGLHRDLNNALSESLWSAIDEIDKQDDITLIESEEKSYESEFSEAIFVQNLLLSIQNIRKVIKNEEDNSELISCGFLEFDIEISKATRLEQSSHHMKILKLFVCKSEENFDKLRDIMPLLNYYSTTAESVLYRLLADFNSISKISTLISLLATNLAIKGFCTPEDLLESEEGEGKLEISGDDCAGMASGKGQKDVSNEIENEEQVEGTRGEEENNDEDDVKGEDNAIEMTDDFGGEDRDPHTEEKGEDDESQEEEEDEIEHDKEMGDVGDDGEKLDEKLWGSDNEDDEEEGQNEEQGGGDETKGESQLVAKDDVVDAKESNDNKNEENEENVENSNQQENIKEEDPHDDRDFDENETDKHDLQPQETPEIEDLPEDLEKKDEVENEKGDVGSEAEDDENPEENPLDIDNLIEDNKDENVENDREEPSTEAMEINEEDQEKFEEEKQEDQEIKDHSKTASSSYENAIQSEVQSGSAENEIDEKEESGDGSAKSQTQGRKGEIGKATPKSREEDNNNSNKQQEGKLDQDRSTTETMNEKVKRLQTVERQEERMEYEEMKEADVYEHLKEGEAHDEVTLDSATKDQRQSDLNIEDEEDKNDYDDDLMDDEESKNTKEEIENLESAKSQREAKDYEKKLKDHEKTRTDDPGFMEIDGEVVQTHSVQDTQSFAGINYEVMEDLPKTDIEEMRKNLEETMTQWLKVNDKTNNECMQRWRQYEICTSSLSRQLCEQLRLVLEPTKKNRLEGDYRSGKRLNMKKVVAYVASDFRKDKIWLRRTKARDRDYHVMLAVDNSASMVKNRCVQVAFEAIAVLANAFKFLEIGKFGLVSFGEKIDLVHDLNEPWSSESGAKVLQGLQFDGSQTRITEMMKRCAELIYKQKKVVKDRSISELLIIVSDGRSMYGEGMEKVKRSIREARQSGLFVVFVIIDHPDSKDSIMQMRIPRMERDKLVLPMQLVSYMENFPFPFYVVLRDVEALPLILSDALKQWFEIVATSDN